MAIRDDSSRGLLLVAGATFFWSLSGVFARWLPQVDPWTFNATRGLGMGIALLLWMAWKYRLGAIALFRQSDPVALLISGGFFAAGSSLYILALQLSSVAAASCIGATSGIFAAILARFWLGERTPLVFYMAVVMAIVGVARSAAWVEPQWLWRMPCVLPGKASHCGATARCAWSRRWFSVAWASMFWCA